jgi:hypothetical protein
VLLLHVPGDIEQNIGKAQREQPEYRPKFKMRMFRMQA